MCGIFGFASNKNIVPKLISGLKKLEYRGYDSSGIAIINKGKLEVVKKEGRISNLEKASKKSSGTLGIAHTRWATHGKPSDDNSHPHTSGKFALVHNGIIENFDTLKTQLLAKGFKFSSQTDTEVIAHMLNHIYTGNMLESLKLLSKLVIGSYALAVINQDDPNTIYVTKCDSPLLVGKGEEGVSLGSDAIALGGDASDIYILDDHEYAILTNDSIEFFDKNLKPITKQHSNDLINTGGFDFGEVKSFMLKEMLEIPDAIENTLAYYRSGLDKALRERLKTIDEILIVGCGTAYHGGVMGGLLLEELAHIPTRVEIASEFRYKNNIIKPNTMVIAISQSGETADTIAALKHAKAHPNTSLVLSITNVQTSSIVKVCDFVLPTIAGVEIAVASTKCYNTQLTVLYLLAYTLANIKRGIPFNTENFTKLKDASTEVLKCFDSLQEITAHFFTSDNVFFLGRNLDYATALEGSLKLKEISYIHSEGYPAGELKHGTLALIEDNSLVIVLATQSELAKKTMNALHEVKARGAKILLVTQLDEYINLPDADYIVKLPKLDDIFMPIISSIPLQLFAYFMAIAKGNDPDKPRNLAKSVTVE